MVLGSERTRSGWSCSRFADPVEPGPWLLVDGLQKARGVEADAVVTVEGEEQWLVFDVWRSEGAKKFRRSAPPPPVWRVVTIPLR